MKNYLLLILLSAISILLVPLAVRRNTEQPQASTSQQESEAVNATVQGSQTKPQQEETIAVFRTASGKNENITMFEYICGSVAAEMPLAYDEEALKAQAIACYTNALRLKKSDKNPDDGNITDNTSVHQGYIDEAQRKEKWGKDFEKYEKKLQEAVKAVSGKAIYYDGKLCVAAFCAISNGKTEAAQNIWGSAVPYLVSVDSSGDKLSPGYASTVSYEEKDFLKILKEQGINTESIKTLEGIIEITSKSSTGTVLKCKIAGKEFTGEEVRKLFSLRSPTFTVKGNKNAVTFIVSGYGHGIGLSQYGSDYLAKQGYTYDEILKHYYTGIQIK